MDEPPRLGSLCSGYGGLDLAAMAVFGAVPVFHAETDPAAARVLARRFPGTPNLGDITACDWSTVPRVDVLCAGYPCQPESVAGKRKGVADDRWIWPAVHRAIRVLRPRLVLLENVQGHVSSGFRTVLGDLAASRFDAEWLVLAASELGAAHQRKRLFVAAWPADPESIRRGQGPLPALPPGEQGQPRHPHRQAPDPDRKPIRDQPVPESGRERAPLARIAGPGAAADPASLGEREPADQDLALEAGRDARPLARGGSLLPTLTASDGVKGGPNHTYSGGDPALGAAVQPAYWGRYTDAVARHEHFAQRPAPAPTDPGPNGPRLAPRFAEWLMALPDGWVTEIPEITRADQLRLLGNGVIPAQAEAAYRELARRALT